MKQEGTDGGEPGKMRREDGIGYLNDLIVLQTYRVFYFTAIFMILILYDCQPILPLFLSCITSVVPQVSRCRVTRAKAGLSNKIDLRV